MRQRVFAFIIRHSIAGHDLLIFDHLGYPEAGVQVPGGTIEPGETPDDAIMREVHEESGIETVTILRKLPAVEVTDWQLMAHPYLLRPTTYLPEHWDFTTNDFHDKEAKERGEPLIFCYRWTPLPLIFKLAGPQMDWLEQLTIDL
jgi:8-oxo-dGTP pyrophosphatase MutT (NUDIX family)